MARAGCADASCSRVSARPNPYRRLADGVYDLGVVTGMPAWPEVHLLVARELGERVDDPRPLAPAKQSAMTWAARAQGTGAIVVKVRESDDGRADEKAQWCAAHLPALGARGYPVPAILWHGMVSAEWQVTVQSRLPGRPLGTLDGPVLEEALGLVELQAGAGIADESRDFTSYVANVLFDDWDDVWANAPRACPAAGPLCARLRRWLEPAWGLRLPAADYAHNDLNPSNILTDGNRITGVVDWDEFGLGSRALDLIALAFDCERGGDHAVADRLLGRAARVAGGYGLRCLVSYRTIAGLAYFARERQAYGDSLGDAICAAVSAILDRLVAVEALRPALAREQPPGVADGHAC
jgi:Ser/Thr protein kinase RdoA (MazF antagonist)